MLPQQILQILSKSMLENLDIGDFIQGRVTSVKDGLLQMRLMDGSSFTASVPDDMIIQEGALLTLQIGEKSGDQMTAKIVNNGGKTEQAPASRDLPAEARVQLQAFGEKATDALVAKVIDLVENNPSLGVEKASFLVANKMEPDNGMQDIIMKLAQKEFEEAKEEDKPYFDQERLFNPYSDTRVLAGSEDLEINKVLAGIDIEVGELLLADRLRERGNQIDLVLSHHPEGKALAALDDVMHLQEEVSIACDDIV
jgi:hypothetical protein